jgi:hypothetical protein
MRRMMLEVASSPGANAAGERAPSAETTGGWFTRTTVLKRFPELGRAYALTYHLREAVKAGWLERQHIEGRPPTGWQRHGTGRMVVQRPKARWAYRVTYAGLDKLERLHAGQVGVLGIPRSRHYEILASWLPGRGAVPARVIRARLGVRWRGVLTWLRWNYGTPWPVAGRPGYWEWREATKEELFS